MMERKILTHVICLITIGTLLSSCQAKGKNHYAKSKIFYMEGKYQETLEELKKEIVKNPSSPEAHYLLANTYYHLEMYDEAEKKYRQILKMSPSKDHRSKAHLGIGIIHRERSQYNEAIEEFEKAKDLDPSLLKAQLYVGDVYIMKGEVLRGVAIFKEVLGLAPNDSEIFLRLAHAYILLKNRKEAINAYKRVLEIDGNRQYIHDALGMLYFQEDRYDDAIAEFEREIKLYPDSMSTAYNLGHTYYKKGKFDEAMKYLEMASKSDPDNPPFLCAIAAVHIAKDNIDEGKALLEKVIQRDPTYTDASYSLGWLYDNKLGNSSEALKYYSKFLESSKNARNETEIEKLFGGPERIEWTRKRIQEIKSGISQQFQDQ